MIMLPIKVPNGRDMLVVVLDPTALERMRNADPVTIDNFGGKILVNPGVAICYEEPTQEFNRIINCGDVGKILEWLSRGFKFDPSKGDGAPPRRLKEMQ